MLYYFLAATIGVLLDSFDAVVAAQCDLPALRDWPAAKLMKKPVAAASAWPSPTTAATLPHGWIADGRSLPLVVGSGIDASLIQASGT